MSEAQVRRVVWRSADVARIFVMGMLFLFLWRFFWMVHGAVFVVLLAILIAIVIHQPARWLAKHGLPFRIGLVMMVILFVGSMVGLLWAMIPQVVSQMRVLAVQLPATVESAQAWLGEETGQGPNSEFARNVTRQFTDFVGRFVPLAFNMITTVLGSFAIIVLASFFAAQPNLYRSLLLGLISPEARPQWTRIYDEAGRSLRSWVIGKALTMLLIGVVTYVGLTLFKIPGALALAAFAALMEFIPNFGPTIAAAPAMMVAFTISPITAAYVALFYFLLQQVQNAITVPLVEQRAVNIPPAVLLVWQLMLALGFGLMALFVATPLLAVIVVAVRVLYVEPQEARSQWDRREALAAAQEPDEPLADPAATVLDPPVASPPGEDRQPSS
jgi:predicted PurR-regulated permease PerM